MNTKTFSVTGYMIVDSQDWPQMQTLRSNPSEAWKALFGRKLVRAEREQWKKRGFRSVPVSVVGECFLEERRQANG